MITPPTKSFFSILVTGEATDLVTNKLSPSTTADIREAILVSEDYPEDIQAHNEMDIAVEKLRIQLGADVTTKITHNPLYIPSTPEQIDSVLDGDPAAETFRFTGMNGNPFAMKSIQISLDDQDVVQALVGCHQFDLPSYSEIIEGQRNLRSN